MRERNALAVARAVRLAAAMALSAVRALRREFRAIEELKRHPDRVDLILQERALSRLPALAHSRVNLFDRPFEFVDPPGFLDNYREIFQDRVYAFDASGQRPYVIDCGANVGLAVLYVNRDHPGARILAIEPDPLICAMLRRNLQSQEISGVEVLEAAVSTKDGSSLFHCQGGFSGRLAERSQPGASVVRTVRLRDLLIEDVDLLKLDIEGAETEVLLDSFGHLDRVRNIVLEFHSPRAGPQRLQEVLECLGKSGFRYNLHPCPAGGGDRVFDFQIVVRAFRE